MSWDGAKYSAAGKACFLAYSLGLKSGVTSARSQPSMNGGGTMRICSQCDLSAWYISLAADMPGSSPSGHRVIARPWSGCQSCLPDA